MRNLEPFMVNDLVVVQQDIEINITRTLVDDLLAAHSILNVL